jgi:hypothetical protein
LRFREWYITQDEPVYVMGTAKKADDRPAGNRQKLIARLEGLRNSPEKMRQADINKDGDISEDEWNHAVSRVEQQILEEELASAPAGDRVDVVIGKDDGGNVFIVSDASQKELLSKFSWQAFGGVFGGAALTVACLAYLLVRFKIR